MTFLVYLLVLIWSLDYNGGIEAFNSDLAIKSSRVSMLKRRHKLNRHSAKSTGSTLNEKDESTELLRAKKFIPCHPDDTNMDISFVVFNDPIALSRHRVSRSGFMYNPAAKQQNKFLEASSLFLPDIPLRGPLEVKLGFYFTRPKSHYGKYPHKMLVLNME